MKAAGRRLHLREISGDSETPLETVGQDLRTARLRRGDDLATVSRALKIRKEHLEAVEEDRIESLPGRTYAIGFVRSYAGYLGLDVTAMVERFKEEIAGRHDEHTPAIAQIPDEETRHLPRGWRIVAGVVVLLLGYGAWHLFSGGSDAGRGAAAAIAQSAQAAVAKAAPAPAPAQTASAAPVTPAPSAETRASTAAPPPACRHCGARFNSGQAAATADNAVSTIGADRRHASMASRTAIPAWCSRPAPTPASRCAARTARSISTAISRRATPNGAQLPGLSLATSNAGAIEVALDGQVLGPVGQGQEILGRVSLDPQALVDRFNAH